MTSHTFNTHDISALSGGNVIGLFAAALLQRGRMARHHNLCPHCKSPLDGGSLMDLGPHGIWCVHCVGRQT